MQHFPELQLTFPEARALGCLLEKQSLTPGSYPLTLNSLVAASNQSSSREPVTSLSADEVEEALRELAEKYLVTKVLGGRTPKFEHCLPDVLSLFLRSIEISGGQRRPVVPILTCRTLPSARRGW